MRCVRALPAYLAGELRSDGDRLEADPFELLIPPPAVCHAHPGGNCVCRRAFFGVQSGRPATLAFVSDEPDDELLEEFHRSALSKRLWPTGRMFLGSRHLITVAEALLANAPGQVVRVRTVGNRMEIFSDEIFERTEEAAESS